MSVKRLVAAILFGIVFLTLVFTPLSGQQDSSYDPWLDYNDDGKIDTNDLYQLGNAFSASGDATKNVNVNNFPLDEYGALDITSILGIKTAILNAAVCNLWGYGDELYVGGGGGEPYQARLYKVSTQGAVVDLTYNILSLHPGALEIVAVLRAPNGDVFASTHADPIRIIKLPYGSSTWTTVFQPSPTLRSCYSIVMDYGGYLYFTGRHSTPERSIYRSTNKGISWTRVWTEAADWIFGMDTHEDTIIAGAEDAIIRSPDRGANWSKISVVGSVRNVAWIEDGLWMAARSGYDKLLYSFDDGVTWTEFANTLPDAIAGVPVAVHKSPCGGVSFALQENAGSAAITTNLATFGRVDLPVPGVQVRGVYLTEEAVFIGGYIPPSHIYHYSKDVGVLFIMPIDMQEVEGETCPYFLWSDSAITVNSTSQPLLTRGTSKQTLFFKANATGTLTIQVYDEQTKSYEDFQEQAITTANRLFYISLDQHWTAIRLKYNEAATVTTWAILEE